MASTDSEIINVRERPLSTDIMTLQNLVGRQLMDLMGSLASRRRLLAGTDTTPTSVVRNVVAGGLDVTGQAPASSIFVGTGALMQVSSTIAPVPGAQDSAYRVGVLRTGVSIAIPSPVVDTYYLLEAQMVSTVTSAALRDILNPGTGVFVPTLVDKVREQSVQFQLVPGVAGQAPLPSGGDWVPVAVIKQVAGGGAIANTAIADLRESVRDVEAGGVADGAGAFTDAVLVAVSKITPIDAYSFAVGCSFRGAQPITGVPVLGVAGGDLNLPIFKEAGLVYAANTRYYLYVAPWATTGLCPFNSAFTGAANGTYRGVLVVSTVAPVTPGSRLNGAPITLPAPWGVAPIPLGSAQCLGMLRTEPGNLGFIPYTASGPRRSLTPFYLGSLVVDSVVAGPAIAGTYDVTPFLPPNAVNVRIRARLNTTAGTPTHYNMSFGTGTVLATLPPNGGVEFDYPVGVAGFAIPYDFSSVGDPTVNADVQLTVVGWEV